MHRPIKNGALVLAFFLVASCGQKEVKSIAYYKDNPQERASILEDCNKEKSRFDSDSNCINAFLSDDVDSVQYWKANPKHAQEFADFCVSYSQSIGSAQNCKNAISARSSSFGSGENPVYVTPPK